jgi:hypothetical protein
VYEGGGDDGRVKEEGKGEGGKVDREGIEERK